MLNQHSKSDRTITAYAITWLGESMPNNTIMYHSKTYDCWDGFQVETKIRVTKKYAYSLGVGLKVYVTLELIEMGCCPPWLMSTVQGLMDFGW